MLLLVAIGAALATPLPGPYAPGAHRASPAARADSERVEPVLEHARSDLAALRRGRATFTAAVVAPAVNHVGHLATSPSLETSPLDAAGVSAVSLTAVSAAGMLVLPTLVDLDAQASRRAIRAQGGTVPRVSFPVLTAALSTAPLLIRGIPKAGEDAEIARIALTFGSYAAVLALPLHQMVRNRRARERAGWVPPP